MFESQPWQFTVIGKNLNIFQKLLTGYTVQSESDLCLSVDSFCPEVQYNFQNVPFLYRELKSSSNDPALSG